MRGEGLLLGVVLETPGAAIVDACREAGLLINCTAEKVLRLTPPLIIGRAEIDRGRLEDLVIDRPLDALLIVFAELLHPSAALAHAGLLPPMRG